MNLKHIEINIGKACNNKCKFCMSSKSELWDIKFVELTLLKMKLKKYYLDDYRSVGFLGGDISIHPKIKEIVSYCKELGYITVNVITNGMKFDDKEFCNEIVSSGITRVNISIHSHLNDIEDYLTQVNGGLKRKLCAIDNLNELIKTKVLRDNLSINIVLNKINLPYIVQTVLYFYKVKKIDDIRINFIWLAPEIKENWDELRFTYMDFLPYLKKLIFISLKYNIRLTFDTVPACILYKVNPSNHKYIIKKFLGEDKDHITEIEHINAEDKFNWQEMKANLLKYKGEKCNSCSYNNSCQGVWREYVKFYDFDEFNPILNT